MKASSYNRRNLRHNGRRSFAKSKAGRDRRRTRRAAIARKTAYLAS